MQLYRSGLNCNYVQKNTRWVLFAVYSGADFHEGELSLHIP
jgi:hypothetical protein